MKKLLALLLALALLFSLTACAALESIGAPLTEKVKAMLACSIAHDEDGAYALLYPGIMERDDYHEVFLQISEYFPVKEGYTLTMQSARSNKNITANSTSMQGQYLVEFDGQAFYLFVIHVETSDASGFQQFRVVNKAEYDGLQIGAQPQT